MKPIGYLHDFFSLFFPRTCHACGETLISGETYICTFCQFHLPFTRFSKEKENKLTEIFWGRAPIETGAPLFYFQKGGKVQHLIHRFKYKGFREIGHFLGVLHGNDLRESPCYQGLNMVVPVPLHPAKVRKRGFNQSEIFGRGLAESLNIPLVTNGLLRIIPTSTQTRKTRFRRWENVESVFHIPDPKMFENKNILLVDDVVTTGSTLEACAHKLMEIDGTKVWLATIAITL
jgi:ComF family protein